MPLLEEGIKGNLVMVAAAGAATMVLPRLFPHLAPPVRSAVKAGLTLFLEAEHEADGGLIDRLVNATLADMLDALSSEHTDDGRQRAAQAAIERFDRAARRRAARHAWDEADRDARYRRHVRHLRHALRVAQDKAPPETAVILDRVGGAVTEDW